MRPFVRMDFADAGSWRPRVEGSAALRSARASAAMDVSTISARIGADADVLESLGQGAAPDVAWRRALDALIAEYGANPGEYSQGSNDLTQCVMAGDRANGALSDLFDPLHRPMRELMRRVVDQGRATGRNASLCGDIAGEVRYALTPLDCGPREFSMSPNALVAMRNAITQTAAEARRV